MGVDFHSHNGVDSPNLEAKDAISRVPQDQVALPSGGATVDSQARASLTDLINKLRTIGILK